MKKLYYLIILTVILGLVLTGCLLSNVGQVPTNEQSGISYLTKNGILDPNLVGLWHFDGNALDSSGANDGTLHNFSGTYWVDDQWGGKALSFDGNDDYVNCNSNVGSFELSDPFTIEAWINPALDYENNVIYGNAWAESGYLVRVTPSNKVRFILIETGSIYKGIDSSELDPGWHHIVAVWDGTYVKIYIDGVDDSQTSIVGGTVGTITTTVNTKIGGLDTTATADFNFNGIIDEVRIWSTATPSFNLNVEEPKLDFNPVGTHHTVTATVTIGETEPAPGVWVDFNVTGVNGGNTGSVLTDHNGQAQFTYTGSNAGEDIIKAEIDEAPYAYVFDEVTKYWLKNFVTGGGNIKDGKKVAWTFAGTVGNLEDDSVGQFQIVDHTNKIAYHCNNNFSYLVFSGDEAQSPMASHNTAKFTGNFIGNDGSEPVVTVTIKDIGEAGAGVDGITLEGDLTFTEIVISGGNFQVHNIDTIEE
jgi:hypothetical protein